MSIKHVLPQEIEARSMEIISSEMGECAYVGAEREILKRVIHTSADFDYVKNLVFSKDCTEIAIEAILQGATIVTDTNMALSGINKAALKKFNCTAKCFIADEDVALNAKEMGTTRACASMKKAAEIEGNVIFAIGNAPTALIELDRLIKEGKIAPCLIIGVPVGFVNVVESKELICEANTNYIVAKGRKGGSNVCAAICNALLYYAGGRD